jgi:hypothetical protein
MENDPYRISNQSPTPASRGALRPLLWLGLILSATANAVVSSAIGNPILGSVFGAAALAFAAMLIVHHYRTREH